MDLNGFTLFVWLSLAIGVTCQHGDDCCMNELCPYNCVRCDGTSQCFDLSDELGCSSKGDVQLQSYLKPPVFVPVVLKTLKDQLRREKQSVAALYPDRQCLPQPKSRGHSTVKPTDANTEEPIWLQLMNKLKADTQTTTTTTTTTMAVPTTVDLPWFHLLKSLIEEVKRNTTPTTSAPIVSEIQTMPTTTHIPTPTSTPPITAMVSTSPITTVVPTSPVTKVVPTSPIAKVVPTSPITKVVSNQSITTVESTPSITEVLPTSPFTKVVPTQPINNVVSTRSMSKSTQTGAAMINPSVISRIDQTDSQLDSLTTMEHASTSASVDAVSSISKRPSFSVFGTMSISTNNNLQQFDTTLKEAHKVSPTVQSEGASTENNNLTRVTVVNAILEEARRNITESKESLKTGHDSYMIFTRFSTSELLPSRHNTSQTVITTPELDTPNSLVQTPTYTPTTFSTGSRVPDITTESVTGIPIKFDNLVTERILNVDKLHDEENLTGNVFESINGIPISMNYDITKQNDLSNNTQIETNFTLSSNVTNRSSPSDVGKTVTYDHMINTKSIQQRDNITIYSNKNSTMFDESIKKGNSSTGIIADIDFIKPNQSTANLNINDSKVSMKGYPTEFQNTSLTLNDSVASAIPDSKDATNTLYTEIKNITLSSIALESETPSSQSDITATESEINLLLSGLRKTLHKTKERMTNMTDELFMANMSAQANMNQTDNQISLVKYGLLSDFQTNTDVSNTSRNESTGVETAFTDIMESSIETQTVKHKENGPRVQSTSSWKVKPTSFPFDNILDTITSQAPLSDSIFGTLPSKTIWRVDMDEPLSENSGRKLVMSTESTTKPVLNINETIEIQAALSSNTITNVSKPDTVTINTNSPLSSRNQTFYVRSNSTVEKNDLSFRPNMMKSNEEMKADLKLNSSMIANELPNANVGSVVPSTPLVILTPSTPQSVMRIQNERPVPLTLQQNRQMVQTIVNGNFQAATGKVTASTTEEINVVTQLPITLTESEVEILLKEVRKTLNESKSRISDIEGKLSSMDMAQESNSPYQTVAMRQPTKSNLFKYGLLTDSQINTPLANFTVNRTLGVKPILQEASDGKTVKKTITQNKIVNPNNAQSIVSPLPWMFQTTSFPFDSIWNAMSTQSSLFDSIWNPMPTNTLWGSFLDNWNIGMGLSTTAKSPIFYRERFPATPAPTLTTTSTPFVRTAAPSSNIGSTSDTFAKINQPLANAFKNTYKPSVKQSTSLPYSKVNMQTGKPYTVLEAETKPVLASKTLYEGELVPTDRPTYSATFGQNNSLINTPFTAKAKLSVPNEAGNQVDNLTTAYDESNVNITTRSKLVGNQNTSIDLYDNLNNTTAPPEIGSIIIQIENELLTRGNSLQGSTFRPTAEILQTDASKHVSQTTISNTDTPSQFTQTARSTSNTPMQVTQTVRVMPNAPAQVNTKASLNTEAVLPVSHTSSEMPKTDSSTRVTQTTTSANDASTQTARSISNDFIEVTQPARSNTEMYVPDSNNANSNTLVLNGFTQTASSKFDPSTYSFQTASPTTEGFTIMSKTASAQSIPSLVPSAKPVKRVFDATITIVKANTDPTTDTLMSVDKFTTPSNRITHVQPTDMFLKSSDTYIGSGANLKPTTADKKKSNWWNTEFQPTTYFPLGARFLTTTQEPWNTANSRLTQKDDAIPTTTVSSRSRCIHIQDSSAFCNDLNSGQYKNPKDCTTYFVCDWGDLYRCFCPPNTLFDSKLRVCNWDYAVTC